MTNITYEKANKILIHAISFLLGVIMMMVIYRTDIEGRLTRVETKLDAVAHHMGIEIDP